MLMEAARPTIWIVDDDPAMRKSLRFLFAEAGYASQSCESPRAFLDEFKPDAPGCLILDLQMTDSNGLELARELRRQGVEIPIIVLSGHATVRHAVEAMRLGAVDVLEKPAPRDLLLQRVAEALERDAEQRRRGGEAAAARVRLRTLTPRERELLDLIVAGRSNKQIGAELHIAEKTVANHRARLMEKMRAVNAADLVRMVLAAREGE
jgi:two-component system, LuxR family, response regulator FixJ